MCRPLPAASMSRRSRHGGTACIPVAETEWHTNGWRRRFWYAQLSPPQTTISSSAGIFKAAQTGTVWPLSGNDNRTGSSGTRMNAIRGKSSRTVNSWRCCSARWVIRTWSRPCPVTTTRMSPRPLKASRKSSVWCNTAVMLRAIVLIAPPARKILNVLGEGQKPIDRCRRLRWMCLSCAIFRQNASGTNGSLGTTYH